MATPYFRARTIARWQTRGGRYWIELYEQEDGSYTYRTDTGGGNLGPMSHSEALAEMERRVRDAKRYDRINMKRAALDGLGQPEEDSELYSDIAAEIERVIERHADHDAAASWTYLGDQDLIDIEDMGYTDPIAIGYFGDYGVAVDSDVLVDPGWFHVLKLKPVGHAQLWSDVGTRELITWLEKRGYERLDRFGGRVPSTEEEIQMDHVFDAVARELEIDEETVEEVAKREGYGEYFYAGSSGDVEVWALPRERLHSGGFGARRRHKREPRITTAYERWTYEDVEAGDTSDRGWIDEEGSSMVPDEYDIEEGLTSVDLAVKFLQYEGVTEASNYPRWSQGTWYESSYEDPYSGEREYKHYFLKDFTPAEEREVYEELKRLRAI